MSHSYAGAGSPGSASRSEQQQGGQQYHPPAPLHQRSNMQRRSSFSYPHTPVIMSSPHLSSTTSTTASAGSGNINIGLGVGLLVDHALSSASSGSSAPSSTQSSPDLGSGYSDVSFASSATTVVGSPAHAHSHTLATPDKHEKMALRQKLTRRHRRWLNKVAMYLPKPLRPLTASPVRALATLSVAALFILAFRSLWAVDSQSLNAVALQSVFGDRALTAQGSAAPLADLSPAQHDVSPSLRSDMLDQVQEARSMGEADLVADKVEEGEVETGSSAAVPASVEETMVDEVQSASDEDTCEGGECAKAPQPQKMEAFKTTYPTVKFRENLRKDTKYLTFGMMSGFTSQVFAAMNGIYLSTLSDRVAVLPPFATAAHADRKESGYLAFSKIFDIPALESALRQPVAEWEDLKISAEQTPGIGQSPNLQLTDNKLRAKALAAVKKEKISCWSLWAAQMPSPGRPAGSAVQHHLGLDVEYWPVPLEFSHPPQDRHVRYWDLVMLDKDINHMKRKHLRKLAEVRRAEPNFKKLPPAPDDHLLCFDTLYYTAATGPMEWWQPHAPVWKAVGKHVRFNAQVSALADKYIRFALDIDQAARVPEFISVHIRRGELVKACKTVPLEDCLAPLEAYKRAVSLVREALLEARGTYVRLVLVTTDEKDEEFLRAIEGMGWSVVDHVLSRTKEVHGPWWDIVLDAAIQSKGSAFVGTDKSSMSMLSAKRVQEWNRGQVELVKWGHAGAWN